MGTTCMGPRKNKRSKAGKAIALKIIDQYQPTNSEDKDAGTAIAIKE